MNIAKSKTVSRVCSCMVHFKLNTPRKGLWIRVANLCCPLLPSTTITKNCPSWKIRHHHILRSLSCVASQSFYCWVDWAWRTKVSAKSRSYYRRFLVRGLHQTEDTWWNEQQIRDALTAVPLHFFGKILKFVFQTAATCAKWWGLCLNLTLNIGAWAIEGCKIGSNTALSLYCYTERQIFTSQSPAGIRTQH